MPEEGPVEPKQCL